MKFDTKTNLNMRIFTLMIFTFSVFDLKHFYWENLVQKFKTVCSK